MPIDSRIVMSTAIVSTIFRTHSDQPIRRERENV
jgi:hypothetical protein